jgi:hypothetical protein
MKQVAFWAAILGLVGLGIFGVVTYVPVADFQLEASGERTIELEVIWGGDTYTSEEASCGVWAGKFECELRRGGDLGTVISQTLPVGVLDSPDPPIEGTVVTTTLTWELSDLDIGPYETFCRLWLDSSTGTVVVWGYMEGQGHDGQGFYLADKFAIGQTCVVPRRFISTLQ